MSDDDAGHRIALADLQDQFVDDVGHDRVEAGGRLVVQHDFGIECQGAGQAYAFLHAAGELSGFFQLGGGGKADFLEALADDVADLRLVEAALLAQAEGDVVVDREAVEQGGALEEKTEAEALLGQVVVAQVGQAFAVEDHGPRRGPQQGDHEFEENGLAAPAFADDDDSLPARDVEIDALQDALLWELHAELLERDQRRRIGHDGQLYAACGLALALGLGVASAKLQAAKRTNGPFLAG